MILPGIGEQSAGQEDGFLAGGELAIQLGGEGDGFRGRPPCARGAGSEADWGTVR